MRRGRERERREGLAILIVDWWKEIVKVICNENGRGIIKHLLVCAVTEQNLGIIH